MKKIYLISSLILIVCIAIAFFFENIMLINNLMYKSIIAAFIINYLNTILAFNLFDYSYKKGNKKFLIYNLGGLGIRLLLILIAIFVTIKIIIVDILAFLLIFFVFYFILLSLEVIYFHRKVKNEKI